MGHEEALIFLKVVIALASGTILGWRSENSVGAIWLVIQILAHLAIVAAGLLLALGLGLFFFTSSNFLLSLAAWPWQVWVVGAIWAGIGLGYWWRKVYRCWRF